MKGCLCFTFLVAALWVGSEEAEKSKPHPSEATEPHQMLQRLWQSQDHGLELEKRDKKIRSLEIPTQG